MVRSDFNSLLEAAQSFSLENDSDAVLFLGHPSDPIPRALILDRDLPPWARLLWCYFRSRSHSPDLAGTAPNYDTIQDELGVKGRGTVAAAVHALRVTRWMTLMPQTAQNRRHIYLLHNAPLTFHQAVELDPEYPNRIAEASRSPSRPIRVLAPGYIDLVRYAAQRLYAPPRLHTDRPGLRGVPIEQKPLRLVRGVRVAATPIAGWQEGGLLVTAVRIENLEDRTVQLDPRQIVGKWRAAAFHHGRLAPGSATALYLVSDEPFDTALGIHRDVATVPSEE